MKDAAAQLVNDDSSLWDDALRAIRSKIKAHNFNMWIQPIEYLGRKGDTLLLRAPSRFLKDWFSNHYLPEVLAEASQRAARTLCAEVDVLEIEPPLPRNEPPPAEAVTLAATVPSGPPIASMGRYHFADFVVGPSNQLAYAAARLVAQIPGRKYNPLFIYGNSGVGKTHLLCAIGNELQETHPSWRLLYIKAEEFMNEYIASVRTGHIEEFRARYREGCDALLMDDIQFLAGKDRTQEEFFHTFNSLYEGHKQLVFTADKLPKEIPDLDDRLKSRFLWGLSADVQPPELETRVAILETKAQADHLELTKEVALFLASHVRSNVRELEGLLCRVAAVAALRQQPITLELARGALQSFVSPAGQALTVESIQKEVAGYFDLKVADLKSARRHQAVTFPRQIAMYLARKLTGSSYPELGQRFGGKDHTTVMAACKKIERLYASDLKTRQAVDTLERQLTNS